MEKRIYPLVNRPTPLLDLASTRLNRQAAGGELLKNYSWLATWVSLALGAMAFMGAQKK